MGTVPTITIDKADGLQMFLSKDSLKVEIVSAKSSALNVMVPDANGEFVSLLNISGQQNLYSLDFHDTYLILD
jgi:hypothetical protein